MLEKDLPADDRGEVPFQSIPDRGEGPQVPMPDRGNVPFQANIPERSYP